MSTTSINCPSCGGNLEVRHRFSKMVVCPYCNQSTFLNTDGLLAQGEKVKLIDYGSVFFIGATGTLKHLKFEVIGRIRYKYADGFWDEWLLIIDDLEGEELWLQEDEGEFILFKRKQVLKNLPPYSQTKVGSVIDVNGEAVFITEKSKAYVMGGEGELFFQITPGEQADYIDGILYGKGIPVNIEYLPEEVVFNIGEELFLDDIKFSREV